MSTIITLIVIGRVLTQNEVELMNIEVGNCVAAGVTAGGAAFSGNPSDGVIRAWTTTDAADTWVTWVNTNFDPPPKSAVVMTL